MPQPFPGQQRGYSDEPELPNFQTGRTSKRGKKVVNPHGRSEIEIMFDSRRGVKVKDPGKEVKRKRRSSSDSKNSKRTKQKEPIEPVIPAFPLLTLPRVEIGCREPGCGYTRNSTAFPRDSRGSSTSSGFDSSIYGRTMPLRYPSGGPFPHQHAHPGGQRISVSSGSTIPRTSDSSGTDTSASSSRYLIQETPMRPATSRSRSYDQVPGPGSNSGSLSSSRSARAARAATLEYSVSNTSCPPKPSELVLPGMAVRCVEVSKPQPRGVPSYPNGRQGSMPRCVDLERAETVDKLDPYNTFWHLNNLSNFQSTFKREASIHSCGGFTLNGHPTGSKTKKQGWTRLCSSHKIAFVVTTFSVLVTIGLVITLLLMKKKGMMEGMK